MRRGQHIHPDDLIKADVLSEALLLVSVSVLLMSLLFPLMASLR